MKPKIEQIVIRFDNVPEEVTSTLFERIEEPGVRGLMSFEYNYIPAADVGRVEVMLLKELEGRMGEEIRSLEKNGLDPVMYISFKSRILQYSRMLISRYDVRKLGRRNVGIGFATCTVDGETKQILYVSPRLIKALASFNFSMEIC